MGSATQWPRSGRRERPVIKAVEVCYREQQHSFVVADMGAKQNGR